MTPNETKSYQVDYNMSHGGLSTESAAHMSWDIVRYSQVWEDYALLWKGLSIGPGDRVLSIASAGCNALALLLQEPAEVVAVDLNPAQIALFELKCAAIQTLESQEFLAFCGARESSTRQRTFEKHISPLLSRPGSDFWNANLDKIERGFIHCGRLEQYFREFATQVLPKVCPPALLVELLSGAQRNQQEMTYRAFCSEAFAEAFKEYFGKDSLMNKGRDPAQFRYVELGDVGAHFLQRFKIACTTLPTQDNYYLEYFLTGQYQHPESSHPYLQPENFRKLKKLLNRLRIVQCTLEEALHANMIAPTKVNLSDLFEYMSEENTNLLQEKLIECMPRGGRMAFWNLLVPRGLSEKLCDKAFELPESKDLLEQDRSWVYRAFHVVEKK